MSITQYNVEKETTPPSKFNKDISVKTKEEVTLRRYTFSNRIRLVA